MKKQLNFVALLAALLLSVSCVSTKSPTVLRYTLTPPATESTAVAPAIPFARIAVPAYIDTPQIVTRESENTIVLNESRIWAEPLARSIQRQLPIRVSQKLQGKKLKDFEKVSVFIDRLDGTPESGVKASAQIVISRLTDTEVQSESLLFAETVPAPQNEDAYVAYVQAISVAVDKLADAVAENLSE